MDEPTDSNEERGAGAAPPGPSIYDRLMPLMYALIGAAATMFLNVLICGRPPRCPPARVCAESTARAKAPGEAPPAPVRASPEAPRAVSTPDVGAPSPPLDTGAPSQLPDAGAPPPALDARVIAADAAAPAGAVEQQLSKAVRPCLRAAARSFLLAVRLLPDGKVSRVFVARAPGVNAAMRACITKELDGLTLQLALSYAEWRVRQADGGLSLKLVRHKP